MIEAVALASGSNGNAIYVETPDARLLFDCGLSARRLGERAAKRGVDLDRVDALIVSHEHSDHVAGAGVVHRRHGMPVYGTRGTLSMIRDKIGPARLVDFPAGASLPFGESTVVHTIPTPHDGVDGVCFVVEHGGLRLGVMTDLGHPFEELHRNFRTLDGAFLEANYDTDMLLHGSYPWSLKERIAGPRGHLSNDDSAMVAREAAGARLRLLVLCHLSGENNSPARVEAVAETLRGRCPEVHIAGRTAPSARFALGEP